MSESDRKRPRIDESDEDNDPVNSLGGEPVLEGEDDEASTPPHQPSNNDSGEALTTRDILRMFGVESMAELREFREKIKKHEEEIAQVKGRLDSITGAFVPKTVYALLETAVFESIRSFPLMRGDQQGSLSSMDDLTKQNARYGVARACTLVLEVFCKMQPDLLYKNQGQFKNWAGPSNVPKTARTALVCQGLHGFIAFVEKADRDLLGFWSQDVRVDLGHNGVFLDAVYPAVAEGSLINRAVTEDTVRDMRATFSERAEELDTALLMALGSNDLETKIDEKLSDVVRVLGEKGIRVTGNCRGEAINFLLSLGK